MSDPQPIPGRRKPARAEPLQPDRPARGGETEGAGVESKDGSEPAAADRRKEQSETALSNVRKGYGGPSK